MEINTKKAGPNITCGEFREKRVDEKNNFEQARSHFEGVRFRQCDRMSNSQQRLNLIHLRTYSQRLETLPDV